MKSKLQRRTEDHAQTPGASRAGRTKTGLSQLQSLADASHGVQGHQALQRLADARTLQRAGEEEELMQGKGLQRVGEEEDLMQGKGLQLAGDEEELMQGKGLQRQGDEEELMQGKTAQRAEAPSAGIASSGGLPGSLKAGVESLSGMAMDDVTVHRNSSAPAEVGAHAYAQGRDIHLAPGQDQHLPHEAWHVVQQAQGRVQPTTEANGVAVNDDAGLEREADVMGARSLSTGDSVLSAKFEGDD